MKSVEIAKALGISKATVSLALNGKPGISEKTRARILSYVAKSGGETEELQKLPAAAKPVIRVITPSKKRIPARSPEMGLIPDSTQFFERAASNLGYTLEIQYPNFLTDSIERIVDECNRDSSVCGVLLFASDITREDVNQFRNIRKPMVCYDNEVRNGTFSSVTIDNRGALHMAVDYLFQCGIRRIGYFSMTKSIYNFEERRIGFQEAMDAHNLECTPFHFIPIGKTVDEAYRKIKSDWTKLHTQQAYIMESYHLSVGVLHALRELHVEIPKDVSLIGIDMIPTYLMGDCQLTTLEVPHENRAALAISLLVSEIRQAETFQTKIVTSCKLIEGDSVRQKAF